MRALPTYLAKLFLRDIMSNIVTAAGRIFIFLSYAHHIA